MSEQRLIESDYTPSRFDYFDGYYSVRFSGIEFARFAPSPAWSDYAKSMQGVDDFSYVFVSTPPTPSAAPELRDDAKEATA